MIEAFADPASGAAPLLVRFSAAGFDPDGGALSWRWEFADGSALGSAVTRTFTQPGTYTAKVTATDDEGVKSSKDVQVIVTAAGVVPPTVDATADVSAGPAPLRVQFGAAGHDPDGPEDDLHYTWEFGDGGTSLAQNPSHMYMQPGTYTAKVTARDAAGATATDTLQIVVSDAPGNLPPSVQAAALPASGPAPLEVQLSAAGTDPDGDPLTYAWDFDDGSAAGTGLQVTHTYTRAGTYNAKVTASDGHGGTASATVAIVVGNPAGNQSPTVLAAADPATGTSPLTVHFTSAARDPDGDPMMYVWSFGDGGQAAGVDGWHTYTQPGTYDATIKVTDPRGGVGTATVRVVVTAAQAAAPRPAPDVAPDAPAQAPWFGVNTPAKTTVTGFAARGLSVRVTCTEAMSGSATLKVNAKTARGLAAEVEHAGARHRPLRGSRVDDGDAEAVCGDQARVGQVARHGQDNARRAPARAGRADLENGARGDARAPLVLRGRPAPWSSRIILGASGRRNSGHR